MKSLEIPDIAVNILLEFLPGFGFFNSKCKHNIHVFIDLFTTLSLLWKEGGRKEGGMEEYTLFWAFSYDIVC